MDIPDVFRVRRPRVPQSISVYAACDDPYSDKYGAQITGFLRSEAAATNITFTSWYDGLQRLTTKVPIIANGELCKSLFPVGVWLVGSNETSSRGKKMGEWLGAALSRAVTLSPIFFSFVVLYVANAWNRPLYKETANITMEFF